MRIQRNYLHPPICGWNKQGEALKRVNVVAAMTTLDCSGDGCGIDNITIAHGSFVGATRVARWWAFSIAGILR
ncbi:hypothetical protein DM860_011716 [Cuscuta australis]|uniref:Uncharacterized protein n=1 Tax=Cuscuta australis TaxID=267555 RepID=A0A328DJF0_9ASTE|nr:hypothetical protein DM860_011716 [Cuscuta australis]